MLVGLTAFAISVGPALAVFPPGFDRAPEPARAYDAVREHNPNFKEAGSYVSDEIVVKFRGDREPFRVIKVPNSEISEKIAEFLKRNDVVYAEPNYIAHAFSIPNDPYYSLQWHLDNSAYGGIQTEAAWDVSTGSGAVVAVVDTGIAYENYRDPRTRKTYYQAPDLANTCFVAGYDFVEADTHPGDDNSHGTHVAGTIAQSTDNNVGVAGVAFNSCLMPVRVLDKSGSGSYANVAAGIRFAADNGAKVIDLSLGGPSPSQTLFDAVAHAYNKGVTVVAAAGNDGENQIAYPAAYDDYVIAVGATRYDETLAYYSNYGSSLDLVAPGGDLNVDQNGDGYGDGVLQNTFNPNAKRTNDFGYWFFQGTSMATPHVSGVAALVIAKGNATGPDDVRTALQSTAENLGSPGWDATYGWGLVNAAAALAWSPGPVDNPPTVSLTGPANGATVSGAITISATATDDNGISQVDFYIDDSLIGSDNTAPYEIIWDSTTVVDGNHNIKATAIDAASQMASDSVTVTVNNVNDPPVANAGPDQSAYVGEIVNFDGSASADPDGTIVSYDWDFGDGATGSGVTATYVYLAANTYTVTLTVTDNGGLTTQDTSTVTITEEPALPTMHVGDISFSADIRSWGRWGSWCKVTAFVLIADTSDIAVEGASVSGSWSGAYSSNVSGTTNNAGLVSFQTGWVKGCGIFAFAVDDVTKDGWAYDPSANVETSDSITLP